jgi:hypothetical protein
LATYTCKCCGEEKDEAEFQPSRLKPEQIRYHGRPLCRSCVAGYQKNYYSTPDGMRARARALRNQIWKILAEFHSRDVAPERIEYLHEKQKGRCSVCNEDTALFPMTDRDGSPYTLVCRPCHELITYGQPSERYSAVAKWLAEPD